MLQKRDYICKLDLQICNYAGPPGQKEAFVLRDYHGEGVVRWSSVEKSYHKNVP